MSTERVVVDVSCGQLCMFDAVLEAPFNDWSDRQYARGFSWRAASASFATLQHDGAHDIAIIIDKVVPVVAEEVVRAFRVPLSLSSGRLEIGSISGTIIEIGTGEFRVQVELHALDDSGRAAVTVRLNRGGAPARVLEADDGVDDAGELDLRAVPAA